MSLVDSKPQPSEEREPIPLSLLNDFLYCERRAALKLLEGWRSSNEHTNRGDIVHEHADLAGYEVAKGVTLLRALPVWSECLGLNGKCDIVEVRRHPDCYFHPVGKIGERLGEGLLFPVEFKLGKRRQWENDDVQLCAQALCLEEMFQTAVPCGAVFHADSKRRREVDFSSELRARTVEAVRQVHGLLGRGTVPPSNYRKACEECSLFDLCLPKATGSDSRSQRFARSLFEL